MDSTLKDILSGVTLPEGSYLAEKYILTVNYTVTILDPEYDRAIFEDEESFFFDSDANAEKYAEKRFEALKNTIKDYISHIRGIPYLEITFVFWITPKIPCLICPDNSANDDMGDLELWRAEAADDESVAHYDYDEWRAISDSGHGSEGQWILCWNTSWRDRFYDIFEHYYCPASLILSPDELKIDKED